VNIPYLVVVTESTDSSKSSVSVDVETTGSFSIIHFEIIIYLKLNIFVLLHLKYLHN
jgi:hypothetical protein